MGSGSEGTGGAAAGPSAGSSLTGGSDAGRPSGTGVSCRWFASVRSTSSRVGSFGSGSSMYSVTRSSTASTPARGVTIGWRRSRLGSDGLGDGGGLAGEGLERAHRQRLVARRPTLSEQRPQGLSAGCALGVEVGQDALHLGVVRVQLEDPLARGDGPGEEAVLGEAARGREVGIDGAGLVAGAGIGVTEPEMRLAIAGRAGAVRGVQRGGTREVSCRQGGSGVGFEPGRIDR